MTFTVTKAMYLVALVTLIAAAAVAAFLWWRQRKKPAEAPAAGDPDAQKAADPAAAGGQLQALFSNAEKVLTESARMKGASLASLPAFLVIGPAGSGRTSAIERAGMEARLLAGQVYMGAEIVPTGYVNIWLARQTLFIEVAEALASVPDRIAEIFARLAPSGMAAISGKPQPARGIILCIDQAKVASAGTPDDVVALARPWNASLERAAASMGIQLPVYVIFTKLDGLSGFAEFVSNLHPKDLSLTGLPGGDISRSGCLGATIRPFNAAVGGVYAQEMSHALNYEFAGISSTLRDARVPLLNRQQDRTKLPVEYQFAGDFQKLQKNIVQFLVELGKPNELQVSSFLRGFYFSGTRKSILDPVESRELPVVPQPQGNSALTATTMMSLDQLRAQAASAQAPLPPQGPREITEWLFLPAIFDGVILRDRPAHLATANSSRTDRVRALALGLVAAMGLALLVALTVSYVRNRSLEKDLVTGTTIVSSRNLTTEAVLRIEALRPPVDRLLEYRDGVPLSMRWGLYAGDRMLPPAQKAYCTAVRTLLLQPLIAELAARLSPSRAGAGDHTGNFASLKAYMMMTSHPGKAEESFLSQELFDVWTDKAGKTGSPDAVKLLPAQFRTYGALLPMGVPGSQCAFQPDAELTTSAQARLRALNANDHYQSLLQQAGRGLDPVNYTRLFPNDAVGDARIVPAWFTRQGWTRMQKLLEHPEESLKADAWVLGETKDLSPQELVTLAAEYKTRYAADYGTAWREYLAAARVTPYADLKDAAAKLEKISGQSSFLLNLIGIAAEHTGQIEKPLAVFQPAKAVVPAKDNFQPDQEYLTKLAELKNRLGTAAQSTGAAHDQDVQEVRRAATAAQDAVDKIAQLPGFRGDSDRLVKAILLMPITQIDPLLSKQNADAVNGGAGDMCRGYSQLTKLMPFSERSQQSATLDDVQRVFQPEKGQMWQFYNETLRDSLDCTGTDCSPKSNPKLKLSDSFVEFFRGMNRWSRLLYNGTPDPILHLQVRAVAFNHVKEIDLVLEDQPPVTLSAGANDYKSITWDLRRAQKLLVQGKFEGDGDQTQELFRTTGTWALFEWMIVNKEPGSGGAAGFTWLPRNGTVKAAVLSNGNTKSYKLDIRMGDGSGRPLDVRLPNAAACASPVSH